jgi:hypothetical protein
MVASEMLRSVMCDLSEDGGSRISPSPTFPGDSGRGVAGRPLWRVVIPLTVSLGARTASASGRVNILPQAVQKAASDEFNLPQDRQFIVPHYSARSPSTEAITIFFLWWL